MKNKNRLQILKRILSKSNLLMDDIVQLTLQIYTAQPGLYINSDRMSLFSSPSSFSSTKEKANNQNTDTEQLKKSFAKKFQDQNS